MGEGLCVGGSGGGGRVVCGCEWGWGGGLCVGGSGVREGCVWVGVG